MERVVRAVVSTLDGLGVPFEVIVVDDQAGTCPPGFTLVRNVPTHPADANKNGIVCGRVKGSDE
ncbi:MAG: hypothetical protein K6W08_14775 [Firmicutes bacterium]|nr:hypothetical protein [Bacillota bacterium]